MNTNLSNAEFIRIYQDTATTELERELFRRLAEADEKIPPDEDEAY